MAADLRKEFADITECPICKMKMSDTRTLPCIHTFCRNCLVTLGYGSSGKIKCPCCRSECDVPEGGIRKLPKNYFVEKLLEIRKSLKLSQIQETTLICNFEGHKDKEERHFTLAYYYCVECEQYMCRWCSEAHSKQTLSHQILSTGCLNHREKQLEFFCKTCKLPICSKCLSNNHKFHKVCTFTDYAMTSEKELETVKLIKRREIRSLQAEISDVELQKREIKTLKREITTLKKEMPDVLALERNCKSEKLEKEIALKKVNEKESELEEHNIMHRKTLIEMRQRISEAEILRLHIGTILTQRFAEVLRVVVKLNKIIEDLQQQTSPFVHLKSELCSRNANDCTAIRCVHDPTLICKICRQELCIDCFSNSLAGKILEKRIIEDRKNNREWLIGKEMLLAVCILLMAVAYMMGRFST